MALGYQVSGTQPPGRPTLKQREMVKVECAHNEIVDVDADLAQYCEKLKFLGDGDTVKEPRLREPVVRKVVEYLAVCKGRKLAPPVPGVDDGDKSKYAGNGGADDDAAIKEFLEENGSIVLELLVAADHLRIKSLVENASTAIGSMVQNMSTEQMRDLLGIRNDFTPQQEEQIRRENAWCEEF